jgi:hypothetical protein
MCLFAELPENLFGNNRGVSQHVVVPETKHPDTEFLERSRSLRIVLGDRRFVMLAAVEFYRDSITHSVEIQNIASDAVLPTEFEARQTTPAQD